MSEMLERVAKAIDGVVGDDYELFLAERFPVSQAKDMRDAAMAKAARAAIEAMREPTQGMQSAGSKFVYFEGHSLGADGPRDVWGAMIDEALKDST